ncbi:hypothetical protein AB0E08_43055 [Streptomyces sp. NPDC048281]|uniref:hypothetical protein n=1 Tax=Streptomyces sp. NPDC048281 TaxID=3154715 RepID=UPI00343B497B
MVELIDSRIPGFKGANRRNRWKIVALALVLCVSTALGASYFEFGFSLLTMRATASAEDAANDAIEAEKPPFTLAVDTLTQAENIASFPDALFLFRTPFTEGEQKRLVQFGHADMSAPHAEEEFITKLLTSFHEKPVVMYSGVYLGKESSDRMISPLQITLQSARAQSVTIRDMEAKDIKCIKTDISAVIYIPPQGGGAVERVAIDLVGSEKSAPLMQIKAKYGWRYRPYFAGNFVELGDGQSSWAANLDVMVADKQCRWDLSATYIDSGEKKVSALKSSHFQTPGYPVDPSQLFEFLPSEKSQGFASSCWGKRVAATVHCDTRAPLKDRARELPTMYYWRLPETSP